MPRATKEETHTDRVLLLAVHRASSCVCLGMGLQAPGDKDRSDLNTWDSCLFLQEERWGGECENRWKCNFLMTAADGKKTQECIHTMSEPRESAWPSQNVHGGAVSMAPQPKPGGGPAAGKNRPRGGAGPAARLRTATGGWVGNTCGHLVRSGGSVFWSLQTWHGAPGDMTH